MYSNSLRSPSSLHPSLKFSYMYKRLFRLSPSPLSFPLPHCRKEMPREKVPCDEKVESELWRLCWSGDVDAVKKTLHGGANVNEVGVWEEAH